MVFLYIPASVELRSWLANVVRQHRQKRDAFAGRKKNKHENIKINCVDVVCFPIRDMVELKYKICNTFGFRCATAVWKFRFSFGVQTKTHCLYEIRATNGTFVANTTQFHLCLANECRILQTHSHDGHFLVTKAILQRRDGVSARTAQSITGRIHDSVRKLKIVNWIECDERINGKKWPFSVA